MASCITLTTDPAKATEEQSRLAREAFADQRQRLSAFFRELDDEGWAAPTRCAEWSVQQTVQHLCDIATAWLALLQGEPPESAGMEGFDPRTTPSAWVQRSASERAADTLSRFERTSAAFLQEIDERIEREASDGIRMPYGLVAWSIVPIHGFWDAWLHERDILLPMGRPHQSTAVESTAAASHGLLMSCLPSAMMGTPLEESVFLEGDGGGLFALDVRGEVVTISISEGDPSGGELRGRLPEVVDSLVGRDPDLGSVLRGPADRVDRLALFRRFMIPAAAG